MKLYDVGWDGFMRAYHRMMYDLARYGDTVETHWQAMRNVPQNQTFELMNVSLHYPMPATVEALRADVKPNLPWAEDQFIERIAGVPVNPGGTYMDWPYYRGNVERHKGEDKDNLFSHTYAERFWPQYAPMPVDNKLPNRGIRYRLGDFHDVLELLHNEPHTRQAYLPIWFPEDTGAHHGERVPCSLGYHFMLRRGRLHVNYTIRSCDILRHFQDDVYMAARLAYHVIERLRSDEPWARVVPGILTMVMHSFHAFEPERPMILRRALEGMGPESELYSAAV